MFNKRECIILSMEWFDLFIKIAFIVVFFAVMVYVGIRSRKKANSVNNYVLGGRSIGPWLSAFSYGTAYFSAVIFVGYAGQFGWRFGISATWIGIGNALIGALLAWAVLGRRTRLMTHRLGAATMPDYFGKRFSSKQLRIAASIIIFIFLIPYTASLYNGLGLLFQMAFGIDFKIVIVIMAVMTAVYVLLGGYIASTWNDFIQGIIMLFGIVMVVVAVIMSNGGLTAALTELSLVDGGVYTSFFGPDLYGLIMVIILTSFGTWGLPQMVQKFYAIKSESAIKKGMIISTLFALIIAGGCYFLGGFAHLYSPATNDSGEILFDSIIPIMLENLPVVVIAVVIVLVLSASMSTLSSLVMSSSSTVTLDLIKGNIKKDMSEKQQMLYIRVFIGIFIVVSAVIAMLQYEFKFAFIAQMMGVSWGALAGSFLAPYLLSMYSKKISKASVWACFAFGVAMSLTSLILKLSGVSDTFTPADNWFLYGLFGSSIYTGAWTMAIGFIIVPVVSMFTKKPDAKKIDTMFECFSVLAEKSDEDTVNTATMTDI